MARATEETGLRPEEQRPELSPHYEDTKNQFKNGITFCSKCSVPSCSCNKQIIQLWMTTLEVILKLSKIKEGPIRLSMHHFFTPEEMVYFLDTFTKEWMIID